MRSDLFIRRDKRDFPGGPVIKTWPSSAEGAEILHVSWPENQNIKQKQYCNKINKDFINFLHQKKKKKKKSSLKQ